MYSLAFELEAGDIFSGGGWWDIKGYTGDHSTEVHGLSINWLPCMFQPEVWNEGPSINNIPYNIFAKSNVGTKWTNEQ